MLEAPGRIVAAEAASVGETTNAVTRAAETSAGAVVEGKGLDKPMPRKQGSYQPPPAPLNREKNREEIVSEWVSRALGAERAAAFSEEQRAIIGLR